MLRTSFDPMSDLNHSSTILVNLLDEELIIFVRIVTFYVVNELLVFLFKL